MPLMYLAQNLYIRKNRWNFLRRTNGRTAGDHGEGGKQTSISKGGRLDSAEMVSINRLGPSWHQVSTVQHEDLYMTLPSLRETKIPTCKRECGLKCNLGCLKSCHQPSPTKQQWIATDSRDSAINLQLKDELISPCKAPNYHWYQDFYIHLCLSKTFWVNLV